MAPMAGPGKRGRIHKGERDQFMTRPMQPVGDEIRARAAHLGMTYSDYIAMILAEAVDLPQYAPRPPQDEQGALLSTQEVLYRHTA